MNCLKCKTETSDGMTFEVMKVLSRKVKNPMGRIGKQLATEQELCGFEQYRICDSCIDSKLDAIAHPWKEFTDKFKDIFDVEYNHANIARYNRKAEQYKLAVSSDYMAKITEKKLSAN